MTQMLNSVAIRRIACPICKAPPGSPCSEPASGVRRERHHRERSTAARREQTNPRSAARRVGDRFYKP
jgi:hypothetical protein